MLHKTQLSNPKRTLANISFCIAIEQQRINVGVSHTLCNNSFCSVQITEKASYRTKHFRAAIYGLCQIFSSRPLDHCIEISHVLVDWGHRSTLISSPEDVWKKETYPLHVSSMADYW